MNMNDSSSDEFNLETMLTFAPIQDINIQMIFFLAHALAHRVVFEDIDVWLEDLSLDLDDVFLLNFP